ncbi:MAG: YbaB/EbfC family nucleoid-associated protein [Anaerolineales bacterium]|nr:YbaB/EbfC family nucleoid-associated protein [Anaerolineales bacterium]
MAKRKSKGKGFSLDNPGGGGGGLSMPGGAKGGLAGKLQEMQQQMLEAQEALGDKTVEISAGGGAIKVVMTGHQKLESITIAPEVVDPDDVEMLQDLILAAINEAVEASQNLAADEMNSITGGLNIPGLM